jgi:hypothetical protein
MRRNEKRTIAEIALLAVLALSLLGVAQDQGFQVIYEGPVKAEEQPSPVPLTALDVTLYGNAGFSAVGAFWATAGGRAELRLGGFTVYGDASGGTDGFRALVGAKTQLLGFRVAGDVSFTPGGTPVLDLRGWGSFGAVRITANARLAGMATSLSLGVSTDFGGYGVSGNLGFASGALSTASVGVNTELGVLSLSASGGWAGGRLNAGAGAALQLGAVNLAANAGYDSSLGANATASAGLGLDALQITAIALYDNTGVGLEASGELKLGSSQLSFMGRFSIGTMSLEIGGKIPLGAVATSFSVAFDNQSGFSWAEIGLEMPL